MAKLNSILKLYGSLEGLTIYKLPGVEAPVVRSTWGPSRHDILTKPCYALTRLTLAETGGRSRAVSGLMKAFQPLKPLADFDTAGQGQRLLRAIQKGDTQSELGKRAVLLSRFPQLLEGFNLTRRTTFDTVVQGELHTRLSRDTLTASVELPDLLPRLTFFPPEGYPYCRVIAILGVAPDLLFAQPKYTTDGDFTNCPAQSVHTAWFAAGAGLPAQTLSLALPYLPPSEAFSLVLTVGLQLGEPGLTGGIEPVRRRVGSAKILAAV